MQDAPFTATGAVVLPGEWSGDTRHGRRRVYQKPKVERFGTFRELTQQNGKKDVGFDLANSLGTSCNLQAAPGSHAACTSALGSSASF